MKKIYVSGAYGRRRGLSNTECEANVKKAIIVARRLILAGYNPFVPHLQHYVHSGWRCTPDEDTWFKICSGWISDCDAIYMMKGFKQSQGALKELEIAQELGLQVYYEGIEDRY